jgi:hypothetical protein
MKPEKMKVSVLAGGVSPVKRLAAALADIAAQRSSPTTSSVGPAVGR